MSPLLEDRKSKLSLYNFLQLIRYDQQNAYAIGSNAYNQTQSRIVEFEVFLVEIEFSTFSDKNKIGLEDMTLFSTD